MKTPTLNIDLKSLELQTHDKYGESFIMKGNTVVIDGKIYRLQTFAQYPKMVVEGREVTVKVMNTSFKLIEGAGPVVDKTAEAKTEVYDSSKRKVAKVAKAEQSMAERLAKALEENTRLRLASEEG